LIGGNTKFKWAADSKGAAAVCEIEDNPQLTRVLQKKRKKFGAAQKKETKKKEITGGRKQEGARKKGKNSRPRKTSRREQWS